LYTVHVPYPAPRIQSKSRRGIESPEVKCAISGYLLNRQNEAVQDDAKLK